MTNSVCQESSAAESGAAVRGELLHLRVGELLHHAALCHNTGGQVNTVVVMLARRFNDQVRRVLICRKSQLCFPCS